MARKDDFLEKLLSTFRVEAAEHVSALSSGLLELERTADAAARAPVVERIYREAHSLKGAARAVDLGDVEAVCQSLESVFARWKAGRLAPDAPMFELLHRTVDLAARLVESSGKVGTGQVSELLGKLAEAVRDAPAEGKSAEGCSPVGARQPASTAEEKACPAPAANPVSQAAETPSEAASPERSTGAPRRTDSAETIRVSATRLDSLLFQTEEMLSAKLTVAQRASELAELRAGFGEWKKEWARLAPHLREVADPRGKRSSGGVKDSLPKVVEFLQWNRAHVAGLETKLAALATATRNDARSVGAMVDNLLGDMKKVLMLPFALLLEPFPRMVRELSRDQGKEVELEAQGAGVEVDKRILEELKDPLMHLVRNSVDHGIERPEERTRLGKPGRGTIRIAVAQVETNLVDILISDDGAGIDLEKVKEKAVQMGLLSAAEAATADEASAYSLIYQSGVSTSPIITDLSGRGLGLAIVREKVDKLGGRVSVQSAPGAGTTFRLLLPLTLATFRGAFVEAGGQSFVIPTSHVERVVRVRAEDIGTMENREAITLNGRAVSLVHLGDVLGLRRPPSNEPLHFQQVLVLWAGEKRIAFAVDRVLNEQEVLVKGLGRQLKRVRNIGGAALLGSGQVVPILNVPDLLKSAVGVMGVPAASLAEPAHRPKANAAILIAEDSITSRMLLKNILESSGYRVRTAMDGAEAFTALKTEPFDLVVSDIDMPKMSGFELTERIRADKQLTDLPVVLVTGLGSREHRERGVAAGANAYIVKSSFDQSNLLETVRRLL